MECVALWDIGWPHVAPPPAPHLVARPVAAFTLCLEFTVPPAHPTKPLRLWQGQGNTADAVGLYLMPRGALRLVHGEIDLATSDAFARAGETVCLRYRACARGRHDVIDLTNTNRQIRERLRSAVDQTICIQDALPRDKGFLDICHVAAVMPYGLPPTDMSGFAAGTILQTPDGPRAVETLAKGQDVLTSEGQAAPVRWIEARPRLCLGRMAPVRLRAPYFGLSRDVCVTPDTRVLRDGPTVEYICGTEQVLVRAGDMANSSAAKRDRRQPMQMFYHLMLDDHACVLADRCALETALLADVIGADDMTLHANLSETDRTHFVPVLDRASAQALVTAGYRGRRAIG